MSTAESKAKLSLVLEASTPLAWALRYAAHGYSVLPVWWITEAGGCACAAGLACTKPGKHPAISDWPKAATTDEAEIREWWKRWPIANVGLLMGNGICAVDIDNTYALEELDFRKAPRETPTQRTGSGGYHRLYRWSGRKLKNAVRFMEGADLRTDGGLIVVEPSRNRNGEYSWDSELGPFDVPLAELPTWIADACALDNPVRKPPVQIAELWDGVAEGSRNGRLFSYACKMRREKRPELEIAAVCLKLGERCKPPMSEREVLAVVESSGRYADKRDDDGLVAMPVAEYLNRPIPVKRQIVQPWLCEEDLVMVHAWRGTGKTWFTLSLALGVSTGSAFLRWVIPEARPVVLVEGEMPGAGLQLRTLRLFAGADADADRARLTLVPYHLQEHGIPSLDGSKGQGYVERFLSGNEVLILDSITTLFREGEENEASGWSAAQDWLLRLRRLGITVVMMHHSGKSGAQRGTSRREDVLDTVIHLKHSSDFKVGESARFEVEFEKCRGYAGREIAPFEAAIVETAGAASWTWRDIQGHQDERIIEMTDLKLPQRTIAAELGITQSSVARAIKRLRREGKL